LATDGAETWPHSRRRGISLSANTVSADTTNVAALKNSARSTWLVRKIGEMEPSPRLMTASRPNTSPAIGAVPNVVTRLNWLACSSRSAGTRFGTVASLAGVQNSEAHDARNCTVYAQVSWLTTCRLRFSGIDRYNAARTTSPTIMVIRR